MKTYLDELERLTPKQLMVALARQERRRTMPIALVGIGCRFPGVDSPAGFWARTRTATPVRPVGAGGPRDSLGNPRWDLTSGDLAPLAGVLEAGAYLDDVDVFDAQRFGIDDEEAAHLDPQQRLLLEVGFDALADAGIAPGSLRGARAGVWVGMSAVEYPLAAVRHGLGKDDLHPAMGAGTAMSAASGRLARTLRVTGPAMTIDTACSSALAGMHLATAALRAGECDLAIVGVSHLLLSPYTSEVFARAGMLSPTGTCLPLTAQADGYVRAEGCAVLVLQRHPDADAAGRRPYALVRGTSMLTVGDRPSTVGVPAAVHEQGARAALAAAGVDAGDVGFVEMQANGSRVGGLVEIEAMAGLYGPRPAHRPLLVGSAKATIGYSETASGAAGLIRAALALHHGEVPPQPGADVPDPAFDWARHGFAMPTDVTPWPGRRVAVVNSVGFTGTAAHVVLEVAEPATGASPEAPEEPSGAVLVVSSATPPALAATASRLLTALDDGGVCDHLAVCRTLAEGRDHAACRAAAVVASMDDVRAVLAAVAAGEHPASGPSPASAGQVDGAARGLADAAAAYLRGERVDVRALLPVPVPALLHLPGPVSSGRSHWSPRNRWR